MRSYIRTRAWTDEQLTAAENSLSERGLVTNGAFTAEGRALRESVEEVTDAQCAVILDALGGSVDGLLAILGPWGDAIRAAGGYPPQGPHDLAPVR
jgi:hypothetical protein